MPKALSTLTARVCAGHGGLSCFDFEQPNSAADCGKETPIPRGSVRNRVEEVVVNQPSGAGRAYGRLGLPLTQGHTSLRLGLLGLRGWNTPGLSSGELRAESRLSKGQLSHGVEHPFHGQLVHAAVML